MNNQRGKVAIGIMVVMMAVMILFGGTHLMHEEHLCGGEQPQNNET
jgi:hypothetical protein